VRIPDAVSFAQAAVGLDAGMTSYAAVMGAGGAAPGMKVGIIGLGGLGHIGARLAVLAGCDVYIAELKEEIWPRARELGARSVATAITEFGDVDLDVIVDFAGFGSTTSDAIKVVRRGGRVIQVGLGVTEATVNTYALCVRRVTLVGVLGGQIDDAEKVYELMASGDLRPELTVVSFLEIPDALARLGRGATVGRMVAQSGD
jgi:alcohol dehydrogenase, propanol-preferring